MKECLIFISLLLFSINNLYANNVRWYSSLITEKKDTIKLLDNNIKANAIIEVKQIKNLHTSKYGLKVFIARFPRIFIDMQIVPINKYDKLKAQYKKITQDTNVILAINGGYFGYNNKGEYIPLGLVIHNYKKFSAKMLWKESGIFIVRDYAKRILSYSELKDYNLAYIKEAIQSYPLLIKNGEIKILKDNKKFKNRTIIGFTRKGELIVVVIINHNSEGVSLFELANYLADTPENNGLGVYDALALDGGSSTSFFCPKLDLFDSAKEENYISQLILFVKQH